MSICKSCGAQIRWVTMTSGKKMPLDMPPQMVVCVTGDCGFITDGYTSHFATCPQADQHRKPKEEEHGNHE